MGKAKQEDVDKITEALNGHPFIKKEPSIEESVMKFATAMMLRLKEKEDEGFEGWDDTNKKEMILKSFVANVGESMNDPKKFIDVANLAMMLYRFETKQWYME